MKKKLKISSILLILIVSTFLLLPRGVNAYTAGAFVTTWKTDNTGTSNDHQITIPTTLGDIYNYHVDWGDGNSDDIATDTPPTHTYTNIGTYTVQITGTFSSIYFNNGGDRQKILSVEQWGTIAWTSMSGAFHGASNLVINASDAPDLSAVTAMNGMFWNASSLNQDIHLWNVSHVTNMASMFNGATSFNQDLHLWNVSSVTAMGGMFQNATAFNNNNQPLDWGLNVSHVIYMNDMFNGATSFNQDISSWNVSSVTDMSYMFFYDTAFNQDISDWTVSNVTNMSYMFTNATSFNKPLNSWTVSNVTNMSYMFAGANSFNQDISDWTVSNVTNMSAMLAEAAFNQDINSWTVSNVTDMSSMFTNATSFNKPLNSWTVSNVTNMSQMFASATHFNQDIHLWNVSNVTNMSYMFFGATSFNQNISDWDVSKVTDMSGMFLAVTLSTSNYDALLAGWSLESLKSNVPFHGGNSHYCSSATQRAYLISHFIWSITDGGPLCPDTTPDAFTFTDQTGIALSTVVESNQITVAGINSATPISISSCTGTACEYSKNGGAYTAIAGTVVNGDTVKVHQTSSGSFSTATDLVLDIGGVTDTFSVTTLAITTPSQVTGLSATAGDAEVSLSFTAPNNGGSTITDYKIESKLTSSNTWTTFNDGISIATTATVTGLTNGQSYDFRVSATNIVGTGLASLKVNTTPTAPTGTGFIIVVSGGSGSHTSPPPPTCTSPSTLVNGICTSPPPPPSPTCGTPGAAPCTVIPPPPGENNTNTPPGENNTPPGGTTNTAPGTTTTTTSGGTTIITPPPGGGNTPTASVLEKARNVLSQKSVSITEKTIAVVGLILGSFFSIIPTLFGTSLSLPEMASIPLRIWSLLLAALGLKKRYPPWGVVYDSTTKRPLDPAYVVLKNGSGDEIASSITDIDGRYGFLIDPGIYTLSVNKTDYQFPSEKLKDRGSDELYQNIYHGEQIPIASPSEVITKNIPMDPLKFNWNEFAKREQRRNKFFSKRNLIMTEISNVFFNLGAIISVFSLFLVPEPYNYIIFAIYVILFIIRQFGIKPKKKGSIYDSKTNLPLPFSIIRVYQVATNTEIAHRVSDRHGKFYCLIPNGAYYVKIEQKLSKGDYQTAFVSNTIEVTRGILKGEFGV